MPELNRAATAMKSAEKNFQPPRYFFNHGWTQMDTDKKPLKGIPD
jgi:hypothetical protein